MEAVEEEMKTIREERSVIAAMTEDAGELFMRKIALQQVELDLQEEKISAGIAELAALLAKEK